MTLVLCILCVLPGKFHKSHKNVIKVEEILVSGPTFPQESESSQRKVEPSSGKVGRLEENFQQVEEK